MLTIKTKTNTPNGSCEALQPSSSRGNYSRTFPPALAPAAAAAAAVGVLLISVLIVAWAVHRWPLHRF